MRPLLRVVHPCWKVLRLVGGSGPPATARRFTALAAGRGGEVTVLGEAALLARNTGATFTGDLTSPVRAHGRKATAGFRFVIRVFSHGRSLLGTMLILDRIVQI
jgi:hypothetical protein